LIIAWADSSVEWKRGAYGVMAALELVELSVRVRAPLGTLAKRLIYDLHPRIRKPPTGVF
jgi:hypothetical protein